MHKLNQYNFNYKYIHTVDFGADILQKKNLWHRQCVYRLVCQYRLVLRKIGIYSPVEHDLATSASYNGSFTNYVYNRRGVRGPKSPLSVDVHKVENVNKEGSVVILST